MNMKIFRGLRHQVRLRKLHFGWNHWHHRNYWWNMYRHVHHFGKYKRQSFTKWKRNLKKLYFSDRPLPLQQFRPFVAKIPDSTVSCNYFMTSIAIFLNLTLVDMLFLYFSVCWYGCPLVWHCDPQLWFFWQFKYQAVGYQSHPSAMQWKGKASS